MFKLIFISSLVGYGYFYVQQQPQPITPDIKAMLQNIPTPQEVGAAISKNFPSNNSLLAIPLPKIPVLPATQKNETGEAGCRQPDENGNLKYCF